MPEQNLGSKLRLEAKLAQVKHDCVKKLTCLTKRGRVLATWLLAEGPSLKIAENPGKIVYAKAMKRQSRQFGTLASKPQGVKLRLQTRKYPDRKVDAMKGADQSSSCQT